MEFEKKASERTDICHQMAKMLTEEVKSEHIVKFEVKVAKLLSRYGQPLSASLLERSEIFSNE